MKFVYAPINIVRDRVWVWTIYKTVSILTWDMWMYAPINILRYLGDERGGYVYLSVYCSE